MCWPTSTAPAPPTDLPRRSMDDWNTCAARPSGSATSPTTSHDRSSRPADSDPTYTLDPDEPRTRPVIPARLDFAGVLGAEWRKLFSLRSTWWTLGLTVVLMTLMALGQAAGVTDSLSTPEGAAMFAGLHGAELVTGGYQFGLLTISVLVAFLITYDYSTGMIRSTFAAVPTRLPLLAAKGIVLTAVTVVEIGRAHVTSYAATAPVLADHDLVPGLTDPTTWQIAGG